MELTDRRKKILRAIVDNYVRTAEPVGSKTIAAMPGMDFSPATIRNEMAELTTMGLLEQPHTSAGRVPSIAGYRYYIDNLMGSDGKRLAPSAREKKIIDEAFENFDYDPERLAKAAAKELAKLEKLGFGDMPVCMAKTQYSFSDDQTKLGAPRGFRITVRDVKVSAGAGFVVALTGDIMTMPGLPKVPAAESIDVDENGVISGLF